MRAFGRDRIWPSWEQVGWWRDRSNRRLGTSEPALPSEKELRRPSVKASTGPQQWSGDHVGAGPPRVSQAKSSSRAHQSHPQELLLGHETRVGQASSPDRAEFLEASCNMTSCTSRPAPPPQAPSCLTSRRYRGLRRLPVRHGLALRAETAMQRRRRSPPSTAGMPPPSQLFRSSTAPWRTGSRAKRKNDS